MVEIMIALAILGLLAAMAIPIARRLRIETQNTVFINDLRVLADATQRYALETGRYPPDSPSSLPAEILAYINEEKYQKATPIGGQWGWREDVLSINITGVPALAEQMIDIDRSVDDGSLGSGNFRLESGAYVFRVN